MNFNKLLALYQLLSGDRNGSYVLDLIYGYRNYVTIWMSPGPIRWYLMFDSKTTQRFIYHEDVEVYGGEPPVREIGVIFKVMPRRIAIHTEKSKYGLVTFSDGRVLKIARMHFRRYLNDNGEVTSIVLRHAIPILVRGADRRSYTIFSIFRYYPKSDNFELGCPTLMKKVPDFKPVKVSTLFEYEVDVEVFTNRRKRISMFGKFTMENPTRSRATSNASAKSASRIVKERNSSEE